LPWMSTLYAIPPQFLISMSWLAEPWASTLHLPALDLTRLLISSVRGAVRALSLQFIQVLRAARLSRMAYCCASARNELRT
jgi:hypothetical protein